MTASSPPPAAALSTANLRESPHRNSAPHLIRYPPGMGFSLGRGSSGAPGRPPHVRRPSWVVLGHQERPARPSQAPLVGDFRGEDQHHAGRGQPRDRSKRRQTRQLGGRCAALRRGSIPRGRASAHGPGARQVGRVGAGRKSRPGALAVPAHATAFGGTCVGHRIARAGAVRRASRSILRRSGRRAADRSLSSSARSAYAPASGDRAFGGRYPVMEQFQRFCSCLEPGGDSRPAAHLARRRVASLAALPPPPASPLGRYGTCSVVQPLCGGLCTPGGRRLPWTARSCRRLPVGCPRSTIAPMSETVPGSWR